MKFHLISLGCSKNTADSETITSACVRHGLEWTPFPEKARLVFLNTCGFIKEAKEESLKVMMKLLDLKRKIPTLKVVVFGCLVKRYKEEITKEIPELDFLFEFYTGKELAPIFESISGKRNNKLHDDVFQRYFTPPHVGYLKIAEGCDNKCSYCAIPNIRGPFYSRPIDSLLHETADLVRSGIKEISLVAQDTTRFGTDQGDRCLLPELIGKIEEFSEITWIRIHYLHPQRATFPLLESLFSHPKVLPYFDIPFQHASDKILRLMNRGVEKTDLIKIYKFIRKNFKNGVIRSTFIVGFPGETEDDFSELCEFIENYPIDRLGAFAYSPEEGTPAGKMKSKLSGKVKIRRLDELMTLQQVMSLERNQQLIGKSFEILIDRIENDIAYGRMYGDAFQVDNLISLKYDNSFKAGEFIKVKIISAEPYDLSAERI